MQLRENLPMVVMTAVSAAILIFFFASERATYARQLDGCGCSEQAGNGPIWSRAGHPPQASWSPAFPPSPPDGCPGSPSTRLAAKAVKYGALGQPSRGWELGDHGVRCTIVVPRKGEMAPHG
jgi:hypothetical protein